MSRVGLSKLVTVSSRVLESRFTCKKRQEKHALTLTLLSSGEFCSLLIIFANSLDPEQA